MVVTPDRSSTGEYSRPFFKETHKVTASSPQTDFNHAITNEAIAITEAAAEKFVELIKDADEDIKGVRVYVGGGGCSGMNYGMTFAEAQTEWDSVLEAEGYRLYVDPVALNYMKGAEIDYVDDGMSATFVFNNVFQAVGGSGACAGCGAAGH